MASRFGGLADLLLKRAGKAQALGGANFQGIFTRLQAAQEKANRANEQRYQEILKQYEGLGTAGRARIEQQTGQQQAAATQRLTSRGLGGTTITSAVSRGIASDAEMQRQQLEESVAMQRAGVMERRTDEGPDLSMYANLMQMAGQQGGQQRQVVYGGTQSQGPGILERWKAQQAAGNAAYAARKAQGALY